MRKSAYADPKIKELIQELAHLKTVYHGFTMAVSREADLNYNNLSSMITQNRHMGYHSYFAIIEVLPKVKRQFLKKKKKI